MNILFIQTDQQRRDSLPCYGHPMVQAPNVQRLADEGVVFENAFTTVPLCAPARASLLTGKRPIHHGLLFNCESGCVAGRDFFEAEPGFGSMLRRRGYDCTHVGKWHIGTELTPAECGFDGVFYPGYGNPAFGGQNLHPHYLDYLRTLGMSGLQLTDALHAAGTSKQQGALLTATHDGGVEASLPYYLAQQAIDAIRDHAKGDRPFFVSCNFWGPHAPYVLPESHMTMYDPADVELPATTMADLAGKPRLHSDYVRYWGVSDLAERQWARLVAACYGYASLIDEQIGRMLACLAECGVEGETAVIFTSDHGGMVGAHGLKDKGPYLYDAVTRIPQIIRLPEQLTAGTRDSHVVYNMDLMPTFLELAGAEVPDDLDGQSLAGLCRGCGDTFSDRRAAFAEYHGHQVPAFGRMVRTDRMKYVFNASGLDELYDLQADPDERTNLIDQPAHSQYLAQLRDMLADYLRDQGDPVLRFYLGTRFD